MKKVFQKNQMIIMTLAVVIAVAGYVNYSQKYDPAGTKNSKTKTVSSQSDQYRYPYEPTPYSVLQRLANTGLIRKNNMLLDYGCGKGRVDFFLSYQTRCRCLGVEYDERIYEKVMENKKEAVSKERVSFSLANAEEFQLPEQIDRIYFFNPFSVEILRKSYISDDGG